MFVDNEEPIKPGMLIKIMLPEYESVEHREKYDGVIAKVKDHYVGELWHLENITEDISFHRRILFPVKDNKEDILKYLNEKYDFKIELK